MTLGELRGDIAETWRCLSKKVKVGIVVGAIAATQMFGLTAADNEIITEVAAKTQVEQACLDQQNARPQYLQQATDSNGNTKSALKACGIK
jgi:hypothetical protein